MLCSFAHKNIIAYLCACAKGLQTLYARKGVSVVEDELHAGVHVAARWVPPLVCGDVIDGVGAGEIEALGEILPPLFDRPSGAPRGTVEVPGASLVWGHAQLHPLGATVLVLHQVDVLVVGAVDVEGVLEGAELGTAARGHGSVTGDSGIQLNLLGPRWRRDDEWVDEATFVDVTFWGRTAEVANEYLIKGSPVLIEGRLKLETWEKDGQKRSKLKVVCDRMQMLGTRKNGNGAAAAEGTQPEAVASAAEGETPF